MTQLLYLNFGVSVFGNAGVIIMGTVNNTCAAAHAMLALHVTMVTDQAQSVDLYMCQSTSDLHACLGEVNMTPRTMSLLNRARTCRVSVKGFCPASHTNNIQQGLSQRGTEIDQEPVPEKIGLLWYTGPVATNDLLTFFIYTR